MVLVGGVQVLRFDEGARLLPHGDTRRLSIAAASIMAKATRDRIMDELALRHPGCGSERNRRRAAAEPSAALPRSGASAEQRAGFRRVRVPDAALAKDQGRMPLLHDSIRPVER